MKNALIISFLFFIGCIFGWVLELFFRRFAPSNKEHRWINPGFLAGPYLPIYGFGLCALYLMAELERFINIESVPLKRAAIVILMCISMTAIEYIAGIIFIKGMNVKLWDYGSNRFNIQGIICPLYSFCWGVLGAIYYFLVHPRILSALDWFSRNLAFSFVVGMFFGVFLIDVGYSFHVVVKIRQFASENKILIRYEELKENIQVEMKQRKEKYRFIFAMHTVRPMSEHLKSYLEKTKARLHRS